MAKAKAILAEQDHVFTAKGPKGGKGGGAGGAVGASDDAPLPKRVKQPRRTTESGAVAAARVDVAREGRADGAVPEVARRAVVRVGLDGAQHACLVSVRIARRRR